MYGLQDCGRLSSQQESTGSSNGRWRGQATAGATDSPHVPGESAYKIFPQSLREQQRWIPLPSTTESVIKGEQ